MNLPFRPHWLFRSPHVQTLIASQVSLAAEPPSVRHEIRLPDGDLMSLRESRPEGWTPGDPTLAMLHGLTGSHRSSYMRRLTTKLVERGVRAIRVNYRGAGCSEGLARLPYHGGCSMDVRVALEWLKPSCGDGPLHLAGFSLGGNIALKLAGELGAAGPELLDGVFTFCAAADLPRCVERLMEHRFYEWGFVRNLYNEALRRHALIPDLEPFDLPRNLRIMEFDDRYVARLWGFKDALDYYHQASARPHVEAITVPTRVLLANDDPIIDPQVLAGLKLPPEVSVEHADGGGHLGFLGPADKHGLLWMDLKLLSWLGIP